MPTSPSAGDPATKFGIAIGSGATLPSVTCNFVWALASDGSSKPAAAPAPPIRTSRREGGDAGSEYDVTGIAGSFPGRSAAKHLLGIEIDVHVFPLLVGLVAQHGVGLTLQHGSKGCFGRGLIAGRASGRNHLRRCCETAIRIQPDSDRKSTRLNSSHVSISYAVCC